MDFLKLDPAARDAHVERAFGLTRNALDDLTSGSRVVVVSFKDRLPPKLVVLHSADVERLDADGIALYWRGRGWL